ncbi:diguanylate cyclase [Leptothermofonsia sichuanensis E412]|uniref:CHASE2 domain-containing protein n=1 Tax=Leptothermofonsia sichuanensis TaxID=2917832 RepID=UPI001CA75558|nr:CHASE2 domain-containing protein [Leptothermofonsia sichuanensis]QZZ20529.1 diguanylate cyclase [Leptothermofonsia sichuanensis E412]
MTLQKQWHRLGSIPIGVTLFVIALQWSGALQLLEWIILNQWFRLRPPESRTVPIVLVTISESDIQWAGRWPLSDGQLAALLNRVKRDRPIAIGLDLYRDLPIQPRHADLMQVFATTPNLIGITKAVGNTEGPAVPPPPLLQERGQIGANDLLLDADGVVRRNLLSVDQNGRTILALGTRLALLYLEQQGIVSRAGTDGNCTHLGKAKFCRLEPNAGGYVRLDTGGNQTLANFLQISGDIPSVSLVQVMTNQVPAFLFRDKIVLIGAKADSLWGDRFYTPYTTESAETWSGVEIHANVTAQILSSALEGRPLLQPLPEFWEWGWIFLWAGIGTGLGWSLRSLRWAMVLIPGVMFSFLLTVYGLFLLGWWAIAVSPILALTAAGFLSHSYRIWQTLRHSNQLLELKVQERTQELIEKNIALEKAHLAAETAKQVLEYLARTDELTQVANRRCFNEYLNQEWQQMMQANLPLSLILIDIDFFKLYNDTYGHPAGDQCLCKVAAVLQSSVRKSADLVARYGGEEFAIILPNTPMAGAMQIATSIQTTIKHLQIPNQNSSVSQYVTVSMGVVCTVPSSQNSFAQLINKADETLYQAKIGGRNQAIAKELLV